MATFTNQATLSYNNNVTSSNIVTGELLEVLSATKTAVMDTYAANETVTYIINIVNTGPVAFPDLTISDDLGAYALESTTIVPLTYEEGSLRYFSNGILQAPPSVSAGPPLTIRGINLPAGGNVALLYNVRLNIFAPLGTNDTITNTATITGARVSTPITASETIMAASEAYLTISKAISPSTVTEREPVTYTFVIQNHGNTEATAATRATVTDTFDPILSNMKVSFNGVAWTEGLQYTYDATTGLFTTAAGEITVPAASYTQDPVTGVISVTPGVSVLSVSGTL